MNALYLYKIHFGDMSHGRVSLNAGLICFAHFLIFYYKHNQPIHNIYIYMFGSLISTDLCNHLNATLELGAYLHQWH